MTNGGSFILRELKGPSAQMRGLLSLKTRFRPLVCPLDAVLENIPERGSLYDFGCGSGTLLYLAKRLRGVERASGHDISPAAIASARVFVDREPGIAPRLLAVDEFPQLSGYDVITMVDVLHHIPPSHQPVILERVVSGMDEGARLVVLDIDAGKPARAIANQLHDLLLSREWVHPLTSDSACAMLEKLDVVVAAPCLINTLWYGHYLITATKRGAPSPPVPA